MAIKTPRYYQHQGTASQNYWPVDKNGTLFRPSPNAFRPTGQGQAVRTPVPVADAQTANAFLRNNGAAAGDPAYVRKLYLWVDSLVTAWSLTGDTTQTSGSRTFYPRNMHQDELIITGTMPNQYEFDKLIRFVERAHWTALNGGKPLSPDWDQFLDFLLFRPTSGNTFDFFQKGQLGGQDPILGFRTSANLGIIIEGIQAGHERFQFAPAFTLKCRIVDDRTDKNRQNLYFRMLSRVGNKAIYGKVDSTPYVAESQSTISSSANTGNNKQSQITVTPSTDQAQQGTILDKIENIQL